MEHENEKEHSSTPDGPDYSAVIDGVRFTRRMFAGEACDGGLASIETPEECQAALDALSDPDKRMERVTSVSVPFEPKGCYSKCFSEFVGHHCRRFNEKGNGRGANGRFIMMCKNESAQGLERFARVSEKGATCQSKDYVDITNVAECSEAFKAATYDKGANKVRVVYSGRKPKGCYSDCRDRDMGFYCRTFNRHGKGSGHATNGMSRFLVCKERRARLQDVQVGGIVRRIFPGERCEGQLRNIDTLDACKAAFDTLHFSSKKLEDIKPIR